MILLQILHQYPKGFINLFNSSQFGKFSYFDLKSQPSKFRFFTFAESVDGPVIRLRIMPINVLFVWKTNAQLQHQVHLILIKLRIFQMKDYIFYIASSSSLQVVYMNSALNVLYTSVPPATPQVHPPDHQAQSRARSAAMESSPTRSSQPQNRYPKRWNPPHPSHAARVLQWRRPIMELQLKRLPYATPNPIPDLFWAPKSSHRWNYWTLICVCEVPT